VTILLELLPTDCILLCVSCTASLLSPVLSCPFVSMPRFHSLAELMGWLLLIGVGFGANLVLKHCAEYPETSKIFLFLKLYRFPLLIEFHFPVCVCSYLSQCSIVCCSLTSDWNLSLKCHYFTFWCRYVNYKLFCSIVQNVDIFIMNCFVVLCKVYSALPRSSDNDRVPCHLQTIIC